MGFIGKMKKSKKSINVEGMEMWMEGWFFFFSKSVSVTSRLLERWEYANATEGFETYSIHIKWCKTDHYWNLNVVPMTLLKITLGFHLPANFCHVDFQMDDLIACTDYLLLRKCVLIKKLEYKYFRLISKMNFLCPGKKIKILCI